MEIRCEKKELKLINTYPPLTRITYTKKNDGYIYMGQVMELTGYFDKLKIDAGILTGYMNEDFSLDSGASIRLDFSDQIRPISISKFIYDGKNKYILSGAFESEEIFFVDQVVYGNYPGDMLGQGNKKWLSQARSPRVNNSFISFLTSNVDWAPAINKPEDMMINLDDADIKNENQSVLENWLLTGSKNGTNQDSKAIKVYDTYDIEESLSGSDQAWLNARINRNPLDTSLPIDWTSLGLDLDGTGPQLLTYFVTDSQLQTSTTSRWLNKVDDLTVYTEEYALSAENFDISVEKVRELDAVLAKKMSGIKLWELFGDHEIIDNGTMDKNTALVDSEQLETLQAAQSAYEAKKEQAEDPNFEDYSDVIKPYPLTISYTYQNKTGETKKLTRKLTVFVTNETTKIDKQMNQVIYGFNFSYALKLARNLTDEQITELAHASAWKYNHSWGVDTSLRTFTTNRAAPYQPGINEQKTGVNNARNPRDDYELALMNETLTNSLIRVKLYENEVTLHIRQMIQNENEASVIPSKGYVFLSNLNDKDPTKSLQELQVITTSGIENQSLPYTTVKIPVSYDHYFYLSKVVLPEYYATSGYIVTTTDEVHDESQKVSELPIFDFTKNNEYWLSIYLKPIESEIKPYSWNYQSSQLGEMKQ